MKCNPAVIILFCTIQLASTAFAQKGVNSIYSAYGIGDSRTRDQHAFMGMGGVGVAMPSVNSINETNAASYAWLPKNSFKAELTLAGLSTRYLNENVNISAGDFTLSRMALAFQVINPVRTVVGLKRLSQVEYYTTASRAVGGTEGNLGSEVEGSGGLYQVYAGNALKIGKNLALGVNAGFIFGSVNTRETLVLNSRESFVSDANKFYHHASVSGGFQYQVVSKKSRWTLGGFYEPQVRLNVEEETVLKDQDEQPLVQKDRIYSKFTYPQRFGAGLSFSRQAFTASVDFIAHLWEATGYRGRLFTTTDAYNFSAGIRHQFTRTTYFGTVDGISLYAGYNRDNSYLIISGKQIVSNAITLGATFPSKNNLNFYSVGGRAGTRGAAVYPLVKEKFFEFNFNFSLGDFLYKGKKYN